MLQSGHNAGRPDIGLQSAGAPRSLTDSGQGFFETRDDNICSSLSASFVVAGCLSQVNGCSHRQLHPARHPRGLGRRAAGP